MSEAILTIARSPDSFTSIQQQGDCLLLPSSLDLDDPCLSHVLSRNRSFRVRIPTWRGPVRSATLPVSGGSVRLDREVLTTPHVIAVVNLDIVGATGPFALDLLARYGFLFDRFKLRVAPNKLDTVARLNQVRPIDAFLVTKSMATGSIWIETRDPIAAELTALALSEGMLPSDRAHPSPWEDELVQRATELELGARYPGDIRLKYDAKATDPDVKEVISALHLRIGIDI